MGLGRTELLILLVISLGCAYISGRLLQRHGLFGTGFALGLLLGPLGLVLAMVINAIKH